MADDGVPTNFDDLLPGKGYRPKSLADTLSLEQMAQNVLSTAGHHKMEPEVLLEAIKVAVAAGEDAIPETSQTGRKAEHMFAQYVFDAAKKGDRGTLDELLTQFEELVTRKAGTGSVIGQPIKLIIPGQ